MKTLFTSLAIFLSLSLFSQPELTLWRVLQEDHNHDHASAHSSEFYECGSYYFFVSDGKKESTWSIKNEGSSTLELNLPLSFDPTTATSMSISQQPDQASLAPGEEVLFKIEYDFYGIHGDVFLPILSNDPNHSNCGLLVGGNVLDCSCYCTDSGTKSLGICDKGDIGTLAGIPLNNLPCTIENESCAPISVLDPCNCDNSITTTGGQFLFRDTLTVQTTPSASLTLSSNISGFKDMNGDMIVTGTNIGSGDAVTGIVQYAFYRAENEGVEIRINGVPFSSSACPSAASCMPASTIPTMGQWGLVSLSLILIIFSILGIKSIDINQRLAS